jgi:hypothetical protein
LTLTFEDPTPRTELSILLYGPGGIGKTVAATSAPEPILYLNADGPNALRYARIKHYGRDIRELKVTGRDTIEQAYLYALDPESGVKSVVWDSLGRIYDLVLADLAKDDKHPTLPERQDVNTFLERHILALLELPVHTVLVAHDNPVVVAGNEDEGGTYELFPFCGTSKPTLAKKIMRPLDIVGYCGRIEPENDGEKPRFVAQLFFGGGRHGKDRTDVIGPVADLDLAAWAHLNEVACTQVANDDTDKPAETPAEEEK